MAKGADSPSPGTTRAQFKINLRMSDPAPITTEFERAIPVFVAAPRRQRYWLHVLLLLLTLFTTTVVGSHMYGRTRYSEYSPQPSTFVLLNA